MEKKDVICVGMALVDSIIKGFDPSPVSASGYRAQSCTLNAGGEAVNEAVTAAKLGLKTAVMCSLGDDMAGSMVKSVLSRAKVDTSLIIKGEATPVTTMFVNEDGTRKSVTNRAHTYNFRPENYLSLIDARAVILGSLFRAPFDDVSSIRAVVEHAHEAGSLIFADTKLPNFRFLKLEDLKEVLPLIDFITPNEDEAAHFSGCRDVEDMADVFLSYGVKNVVIKKGSKGCYYSDGKTSFRLPSFNIKAVDATGAGDNFLSGLACMVLEGKEIKTSLVFASACGAVCSTAVGACTALESRAQIEEFINSQAFSAEQD